MKFCNLFIMFLSFSTAWGKPGAVDVLVSELGLPKAKFQLVIDKKKLKTDELGFVSVDLEKGAHQLEFESSGAVQKVTFQVASDERTQLLINILEETVLTDVTEPVNKDLKVLDETQDFGELELQLSAINGRPLSGVRAFAKGVVASQSSDRQGRLRLKLPLGVQVISLTHPKFSTQVLRDIKIRKDVLLNKSVQMTPSGLVLDDFVVLAPNLKGSIQALIEVRRKASDVADVMSAEQMAKSGDSDAAGSLKRVTGLTLKDGKYVYVRGLGERYSSTLLNGISLPSPDPSRRVVPLDLFPVQFLDSMIIQKSYSADQPGEFGGGVVMLQTKSMPEKFFAKISVSQTQNSNDGNMQSYQGGGTDWLGVDDGRRKIPEGLSRDNGNLRQVLDKVPGAFEDQANETLPNLTFSFGDSWKLRPLKVGYTLSGLYKDNINYTAETRNRYREISATELKSEDEIVREKTQKERLVGGITGVQFQFFKDHDLKTNYINLRNTTDYVAVQNGLNENRDPVRRFETEWAARTLDTFLVEGESRLPAVNDIKMNWHFSESNARRDEPLRSFAQYSPQTDTGLYTLKTDDRGYQLRYYDLQERASDRGGKLSSPFPWFYGRKGQVTLGFNQAQKNRVSGMRRFEPQYEQACGDLSQSPGQIFSQCGDNVSVIENTRETDNYRASQELKAYYFKTQWPLLKDVKLSTGMRYEESTQKVDTVKAQLVSTELQTKDWLPGSTLTWKLNKKMQMRLAYSETVSRPDLRELSDTLWEDFETGYDVQGNSSLKATVIEAYDARWEWYFSAKENVSLGFFYKDFSNPIEQVFTNGSDTRISFFNVQGAEVYGAELEVSKNLGFVSSWLRRLTLSGNYAFIASDVNLGNVTNSESQETRRPLQGQSNYTANFLLDYEHEPYKINASLAYNVYGKRIAFTGAEGLPNVWELPFHQLDFVFSKSISKNFKLQAKVRNILNPRNRLVQGGREWQGWRKGQTYTLGLSMGI